MKLLILISLLFLTWLNLASQSINDSIVLPVIEVKSAKGEYPQFIPIIHLDSMMKPQEKLYGLQHFLNKYTSIFVKEYSPGGLTTISQRGFGASQTRVLWNGFEVNSASLGQMDFSGTSLIHTGSMVLLSGSYSALAGFGGSASTLLLNSDQHGLGRAGIWMLSETGNFGLWSAALGGHFASKHFSYSGAIDFRNCENNYAFSDNSSGLTPYALKIRKDAAYKSLNATGNMHYSPGNGFLLSLSFWAKENYNELPVSLLEAQADAASTQHSTSYRLTTKVHKQWRNADQLTMAIYFALDEYHYSNPSSGIESGNRSKFAAFRTEYKHLLGKHFATKVNLLTNVSNAFSDNYAALQTRQSGDGSLQLAFDSAHFHAFAQINAAFKESFTPAIGPLLGMNWQIRKRWWIGLASATNFRYPSFNDLYWEPGGNPNLEPEQVQSLDANIEYRFENEKFSLQSGVFPFLAKGKNLIQWVPQGALWTPINIAITRHFGFEGRIKTQMKIHNWIAVTNFSAAYAVAQDVTDELSPRYRKDLIYTPRIKANASGELFIDRLSFCWTTSLIGKRFTDVLNTRYMPVVYLHNIDIGYKFEIGNSNWLFSFGIDNIMNADYQIIAWYPMPKRWIHFRIKCGWNE